MIQKERFYEDVTAYVHAHSQTLVEALSELVRRKSVSSSGEGVADCCEYVIAQKKSAEDGQDGELGLFFSAALVLCLVISGQGRPGEEEKGQRSNDFDQV